MLRTPREARDWVSQSLVAYRRAEDPTHAQPAREEEGEKGRSHDQEKLLEGWQGCGSAPCGEHL